MLRKDLKILIVDDEIDIRTILFEMLQLEGFENIERAKDGIDAYSKIKAEKFDLIISDIKMPNMNGVELFDEVHQHVGIIPFLFITAFTDMLDLETCAIKGPVSTISKPFSLGKVLAEIEKVLELSDDHFDKLEKNDLDLSPFPLDRLELLMSEDVSIFIRLESGEFIEFAESASSLSPEKKESLLSKGIDHIYIEKKIKN